MDETHFKFLPPTPKTNPKNLPAVETAHTDSKAPSARFQPNSQGYMNSAYNPSGSPYVRRNLISSGSEKTGAVGSINDHCGPRLIVCIVGGITWSEARSVYLLTQRVIIILKFKLNYFLLKK